MKIAITHAREGRHDFAVAAIQDLVPRLLDAGHEVHLYLQGWRGLPGQGKPVVDPRAQQHEVPDTWGPVKALTRREHDRWVTRNVRREVYDVVHGFGLSSSQDVCTPTPGCFGVRPESEPERSRPTLAQSKEGQIRKRRYSPGAFHRVLVPSSLAAATLCELHGVAQEHIAIVRPGIDTERFHPRQREVHRVEYRDRIVVPKGAFVVLCRADDYGRHGADTVLEAARLLKDRGGLPDGRPLRYAIVGGGDAHVERALSKRAKELGVWKQLKFYGPQNQVECWLAASDLFVLPARFEPDGSPVLEALASEIPVVVSDRVGQAELIEDGAAGVKVPYGDASALVAQILRLAGDPELTARLSAAGRVVAERYTREAALEAILERYAEAAAAKGAVRAGA